MNRKASSIFGCLVYSGSHYRQFNVGCCNGGDKSIRGPSLSWEGKTNVLQGQKGWENIQGCNETTDK